MNKNVIRRIVKKSIYKALDLQPSEEGLAYLEKLDDAVHQVTPLISGMIMNSRDDSWKELKRQYEQFIDLFNETAYK